jgi:hypothetical protein
MKVLMLSKVFPQSHPRAGDPTGFLEAAMSGLKIHTIRENQKGYYRDGDVVEVRQWSGKPYRSKQERTGLVFKIGVEPIRLGQVRGIADDASGGCWSFRKIARNDGLSTEAFVDWFFPNGQKEPWIGSVIHFTNFRYARKGAVLDDAF